MKSKHDKDVRKALTARTYKHDDETILLPPLWRAKYDKYMNVIPRIVSPVLLKM